MAENILEFQERKLIRAIPSWGRRRFYTLGIALIFLGVLFLIEKFGLIVFTWPLILMVTGISSLLEAWLNRRTGGVFPGVFLTLLGLIFLGEETGWISGGVSINWPLVILALSISSIIMALVTKERLKFWISGAVLFFSSILFLIVEHEWTASEIVNNYLGWWPAVLILAGIYLVYRMPNFAEEKRQLENK